MRIAFAHPRPAATTRVAAPARTTPRRPLRAPRSAAPSPRAQASTTPPPRPGDTYFEADARPIMLYDGICRLCSTGVDVALALDSRRALRFAALQSPAGKTLLQRAGRAEDDISSVVLVTQNASFIKSDAVIEIARLLGVAPAALAALAAPLPKPARDGAYGAVADNRYNLFGRLPAQRWTQGGGDEEAGRFLVE